MERDGIIERQPDPRDKRSSRFSLTPATRGRVVAIRAVIESLNAEALGNLPEDDQGHFKQVVQKMILALERALDA